MFPLWSTFLFALLVVAGIVLLVKSIGKLIAVYNTEIKIEWPARIPEFDFALKDAGSYEIAVKRHSLTGVIPSDIPFQLSDLLSQKTVPIRTFVNLLSQRKDMSGSRIVPIAEFTIQESGNFRIVTPDIARFKENDILIVLPKTGSQGFLMILGVLFSAFLFISGLVMFILSLVKK